MAGLDPGPWTLRELAAAAEQRRAEAWSHTSALIAWTGNFHAGRKVYSAADFNPTLDPRPRGVPVTGDDATFDALCAALLGRPPSWCDPEAAA